MSNFLRTGRKVILKPLSASRKHAADEQIVAIGRNYADHAKELGNAIPKGKWTFQRHALTCLDFK